MSLIVGILVFVGFIFSVIAHEVAHGWVALKCGDTTARDAGRLTANPISHIDPIMSLLVPAVMYLGAGVLFGGAKPVPVNEARLRRWPRDPILVALAGVTTNLLIAIGCAGVLQVLVRVFQVDVLSTIPGQVLFGITVTNLVLFVFNLIPIPPLDGSRVFRFALEGEARRAYMQLERYGFLILIVAINLPFVNHGIFRAVELLAGLLGLPSL
jgi:Zn-dependent protease